MTQKRLKRAAWTFGIAALIVLAGFALQGHMEARHYKRQLTNAYYHAFTELTTAAQELDTALRKTAYTTDGPLQSSLYQQVYAKALAAQYALGELPYGNIELEQTAAFFAKTGDYAAALCRGKVDSAPADLAALRAVSDQVSGALTTLQSELEAGALDLEAVDRAERELARGMERGGQELGGATFQTVEADFPELPSLIYDGPFSEHLTGETPKALAGLPDVTQAQAKQAAADFLHVSPDVLTPADLGEGVLPTFGFTLPQDGGMGYIEVTRQGGQVLEYFQDRATGAATMDVDRAVELARNYLANWGYPQMEPSYHIQREGTLTIHFAPVVDSVYCYPDLVKVTIALDTGTLLGYEAHGYLSRHQQRSLAAPAVDQNTATAALPQGLTLLGVQKALIPTAGGTQEVLTWEFKCQDDQGRHVLIYVNAQTGLQQNILLLLEDETGTLTL